jgi:hypothetical protein
VSIARHKRQRKIFHRNPSKGIDQFASDLVPEIPPLILNALVQPRDL